MDSFVKWLNEFKTKLRNVINLLKNYLKGQESYSSMEIVEHVDKVAFDIDDGVKHVRFSIRKLPDGSLSENGIKIIREKYPKIDKVLAERERINSVDLFKPEPRKKLNRQNYKSVLNEEFSKFDSEFNKIFGKGAKHE